MFPPSTHRIAGPAELLDAVPYLLGFRPADSLVLVGLHAGTVGASARLDLCDTDLGTPAGRDLVVHTVGMLSQARAEEMILVVYDDGGTDDGGTDDRGTDDGGAEHRWADLVCAVRDLGAALGIRTTDALLVGRGRWWSYFCSQAGCCPAEGNPLAGAPTTYALIATCEGTVVQPSRAALAATLEPRPAAQRAALAHLLAAAETARTEAVRTEAVPAEVAASAAPGEQPVLTPVERGLVREVITAAQASTGAGWACPADTVLARYAAALRSIPIRDAVWLAVDNGDLDGTPLWTALARSCPPPYDVPPLFLLGWRSWRRGNGVLAGMAVQRALDSDPSYGAAGLLHAALTRAVDPRTFPALGSPDPDPGPGVRARRRRGPRGAATRTLR